jgi:SAM-dependent methyltransferase
VALARGRALSRLRRLAAWPPVGSLRLGSLRRVEPISTNYGFDRGTPVDRHYIDAFLTPHAGDIRGRVLEVGEDTYTQRFGAPEKIDVLHVDRNEPGVTIVADLANAPEIPDSSFDSVVCLQTLMLIWDVEAAIATLHRILAPGGVALVTVSGAAGAKVNRAEAEQWGDWWRFTSMSIRRLFEGAFGESAVSVEAYGNVLTAAAMLYGIAAEELRDDELAHRDPDYEVLLGVRAVKRP